MPSEFYDSSKEPLTTIHLKVPESLPKLYKEAGVLEGRYGTYMMREVLIAGLAAIKTKIAAGKRKKAS
jgi:hypothetical protein